MIRRTPVNLSNSDRYGFEFNLTYNPSKKWRLSGNFNAFQNNIEGDFNGESFDAENFSWLMRLSNKLTLPAKIDWQTTASYSGPNEDAQTKTEGRLSVNMALSKDLFKDKASLTFNVSDLFNTRIRRSISTTETFITNNEFQWRERNFSLSFTYRFNQKKKRQRSRDNFNGGGDDFEG